MFRTIFKLGIPVALAWAAGVMTHHSFWLPVLLGATAAGLQVWFWDSRELAPNQPVGSGQIKDSCPHGSGNYYCGQCSGEEQ